MTPSGGIETAPDNAGPVAIAVRRVAVTGPIAITVGRVAVTGPIAIAGPVAIAVRRVAVTGPIAIRRVTVAVTAVVRPRSERATDYRCPDRCPAPSAAAPTAPSLSRTCERWNCNSYQCRR